MSGNVSVERDGRVATVRIDRGDGVDALSDEVMRDLTDVGRSFEDDAETGAVVLTGTSSVFSLGFDPTDRSTAELAREGLAQRSEDFVDGVASFMEKRLPKYTGR